MKLPVDKEDNEQVVRVPKTLKICFAFLLHRKVNHNSKNSRHNPASHTGASGEIDRKKIDGMLAGSGTHGSGQFVKIDHVCNDMNNGTGYDGPTSCLMKGYILVKRDDVVQRRTAQ